MTFSAKAICAVGGCDRDVEFSTRTYCQMHNRRIARTGSVGPAKTIRQLKAENPRVCTVADCGRKAKNRGLCAKHYQRAFRAGEERFNPKPCIVNGCVRVALAKGMCGAHYARTKTHGDPLAKKPLQISRGGLNSKGYRVVSYDGVEYLEHRLLMEQALGRKLLASENVHHKNGQRADNRPENLELWSKSQPWGQRVADKVAWAIELLKLYPAVANEQGYGLINENLPSTTIYSQEEFLRYLTTH